MQIIQILVIFNVILALCYNSVNAMETDKKVKKLNANLIIRRNKEKQKINQGKNDSSSDLDGFFGAIGDFVKALNAMLVEDEDFLKALNTMGATKKMEAYSTEIKHCIEVANDHLKGIKETNSYSQEIKKMENCVQAAKGVNGMLTIITHLQTEDFLKIMESCVKAVGATKELLEFKIITKTISYFESLRELIVKYQDELKLKLGYKDNLNHQVNRQDALNCHDALNRQDGLNRQDALNCHDGLTFQNT